MSQKMSLMTERSHLILSYQPDDPDDFWTVYTECSLVHVCQTIHTAVFVAWSMCTNNPYCSVCGLVHGCKTIHTAVFVAWSMHAKQSTSGGKSDTRF